MKNNKFEIDMCNGALMPKLISFSVPLMLSSVLQLLFNAVDLIVVGRFAGSDCLAAVGSTSSLIHAFVNLFVGVSVGANVMAAMYFAMSNKEKMSQVVHTSVLTAVISGVFILIIGQIMARPALSLMNTPSEIIDKSALYMKIYFLGTPFAMLYNFGAAILRAVGDTKRPMVYLALSGVINAGLNLLFVIKFNMGVAGVAVATVISQLISCVLVVITLIKSPEGYKLKFSELKIDFQILKKIVGIGIPAGLQSVVISLSNVLLQSSVNSFGASAMAGYSASNNIFGFIYACANAVTQGCMSFTSQNMGAGKYKRMKTVLLDCLILETIICLLVGGASYIFGSEIISIYSTEKVVIEYGMKILSLTTITYFICGYMDCIPGALRGMGKSTLPMILSVLGTVGTRIAWIYLFFPHNRDIKFLFWCYPLSWSMTVILQGICYFIVIKKEGFSKKALNQGVLK